MSYRSFLVMNGTACINLDLNGDNSSLLFDDRKNNAPTLALSPNIPRVFG